MATRIAAVALAVPLLALIGLLHVFPEADRLWINADFHFWAVSAASLMSALACLVLILSARTMRETRIMFLALAFFALAMFFSVHGLATPGFIFESGSAALERSPWLSTLAAGFFAMLSVTSVPLVTDSRKVHWPEGVFALSATVVTAYFAISMLYPDWLHGFPTTREWFQHTLTVTTVSLLLFAAYRYYQSYQFARLPGQLAVAVSLAFLAEAQLSMDFGVFLHYSWWLYHALFLIAFGTLLLGWGWELVRAKDARVIADGLAMRDALVQLNRGRSTSLIELAEQIENHDLETFKHTDRVGAFAFAIGREIGFTPARLRDLVLAAQMHDLGKIGLPPYILQKRGALTESEWELIRQHPRKGWEILSRVRDMESIAKIIRHHHERYDGAGYPDGLRGTEIPLDARIISVADTFDAMTSDRPYRARMTIEQAKAELERVAGEQLDPELVEIMKRLLSDGTLAAGQIVSAAAVAADLRKAI